MSSWTVQLLTILGVAVGAMASFISTRLLDREKSRREEALRWDGKRLESYAEFAIAVKKHNGLARRICAGLGLPSSAQPLERAEGLALLAEAEEELEVKFEPVLMLGTPEAINAAQVWRHRAWHLEWLARGIRNDPNEYRQASNATREARRQFYSAVRADVGVASGPIPDLGGRTAWMDSALRRSTLTPATPALSGGCREQPVCQRPSCSPRRIARLGSQSGGLDHNESHGANDPAAGQ